jgi:hypothetical protein
MIMQLLGLQELLLNRWHVCRLRWSLELLLSAAQQTYLRMEGHPSRSPPAR